MTKYQRLRELYKQFSAVAPTNMIFSIGQNIFTEIVQNCHSMVDGKLLNLSDVDLEFVSTNAGCKGKLNPERALVRHQMMEVFV
jgi:hypothetical protein